MAPLLLADVLVAIHLVFIAFAIAGGLLVLRRRRVAWLHVPAFAWAALISLFGWYCPLTPLENRFRHAAGQAGYDGGFIEHYLLPIVYPERLTREFQIGLGVGVLALNLAVYAAVARRWRRRSAGRSAHDSRRKE